MSFYHFDTRRKPCRTRGTRCPKLLRLSLAIALAFHGQTWALPLQGQVVLGQGVIATDGSTMRVRQETEKMSLNWQSFQIGAGETLQFQQPTRAAIALNRVTGQDASRIMGKLQANGQVFLLNPNGVLFGPNSRIDVGGLVATTGTLSDQDFAAGVYRFDSLATGTVRNQGSLNAVDRGYIALLAPQVINEGVIGARLGQAVMGAAGAVRLTLDNGSLLDYQIERGAIDALADNRGLVKADGGRVFMGAQAADQLTRGVVNNDGVVEALTVAGKPGDIRLLGDMKTGAITGGGRLDASAPDGGDGGFIETSAAHVDLAASARVTAAAPAGKPGTWLIDPVDYVLTQAGTNAANVPVAQALRNSNVTITTNHPGNDAGDIIVNGTFSWLPESSSTTLTLIADNNIRFSSDGRIVSNDGQRPGNLVLQAGMNGGSGAGVGKVQLPPAIAGVPAIDVGNGTVTLYSAPDFAGNPGAPQNFADGRIVGKLESWTWINDLNTLESIASRPGYLSGSFAMLRDVDASTTANGSNGGGFAGIGTIAQPFSGRFDGRGHVISGLYINRPDTGENVGLFGTTSGAGSDIRNLGLVDATIIGGTAATGGIVGASDRTRLQYLSITGTSLVTGHGTATGGLAGSLTGTVTANDDPGGRLTDSWSDASVNGRNDTGGLVGYAIKGVERSYSTGAVAGAVNVGGVAGRFQRGGSLDYLRNVYSTSRVTGNENVGGVVGMNSGVVESVYSESPQISLVAGAGQTGTHTGGVVGFNTGASASLNNIYWNRETSAVLQAYAPDSTNTAPGVPQGLSTAEMRANAVLPGFDPVQWFAYPGRTAPFLTTFMPVVKVTARDVEKIYDGQPVAPSLVFFNPDGSVNAAAQTAYMQGRIQTETGTLPMKDVGSQRNTLSLWSGQQGFRLFDTAGEVGNASYTSTITPRPLVIRANPDTRTYSGLPYSGGNGVQFDGLVAGESIANLGGTLQYGGSAQGAVKQGTYEILPTGLSASNYAISVSGAPLLIELPGIDPGNPSFSDLLPGLGVEAYADALASTSLAIPDYSAWSGTGLWNLVPGMSGLADNSIEQSRSGNDDTETASTDEENPRLSAKVRASKAGIRIVDGGIRMPALKP